MSTKEETLLRETRSLIEDSLLQLSETTRSSRPATVGRVQGPPSTETLRSYKTRNVPIIFTDAFPSWPAHANWSAAYFEKIMGSDPVTVAMTPHGNADSVTDGLFVMPYQCTTSMSDMLAWLREPKGDVRYLQLQNGSLQLEFQKLARDVDPYGPAWARDAFSISQEVPSTDAQLRGDISGRETGGEAAELASDDSGSKSGDCLGNIWIGNHLSKTSLHHDPYENIYVQIRGCKRFRLFPPCDYHWLRERRYKPAQYVKGKDGKLEIELVHPDTSDDASLQVPWLSEPVEGATKAKAIEVILRPGETLYLPALWFHAVEQIDDDEGLCVAVNYWYDLDYDSELWRNWKFMRKMSMLAQGRVAECRRELHDEEDF